MFPTKGKAKSLWFAALLLTGCATPPVDDSKVIATVNGEKLTERDYDSLIAIGKGLKSPASDKSREYNLNILIDRVLLAQHSVAIGMENRNKVQQELKSCDGSAKTAPSESDIVRNPDPITYRLLRISRCRENVLARSLVLKIVGGMSISDAEIRDRFEREIRQMHKTEYRVGHILVKSETEAKDIKKRLVSGTPFKQLAKLHSLDTPTSEHGSALGWVNQGTGAPTQFFDVLLTLKKGATSEPVKSEYGWHIIRLDDTRPLQLPTLEEFMADRDQRAAVVRGIQEDRIEAMVKELRSKARITIE